MNGITIETLQSASECPVPDSPFAVFLHTKNDPGGGVLVQREVLESSVLQSDKSAACAYPQAAVSPFDKGPNIIVGDLGSCSSIKHRKGNAVKADQPFLRSGPDVSIT